MEQESGQAATKTTKTQKSTEKMFSKAQLMGSEAYHAQRDLLNALLDKNKPCSKTEVNKLIDGYLKGEVK